MKIYDIHTHVFPDNIVGKVIHQLEDYYGFAWHGKGVPGDLLDSMAEAEIHTSVIFSSATKASQVCAINDYIAGLVNAHPGKFIGFGTLHPDFPDCAAEIARIRKMGLRGLKFHPDFQQLYIDSPEMTAIYRAAGNDFPILFHIGDCRTDFSSPRRLANVLEKLPHLTAIAAHMGGYSEWDQAWKYLIGRNVRLDISSTIRMIGKEDVVRMVRRHGAERVLFASDYPSLRQKEAVEDVLSLGLTDRENELIFEKNAESLLQ